MTSRDEQSPDSEANQEAKSGQGFLNRWSRLKQEDRAGGGPPAQFRVQDASPPAVAEVPEPPPPELTDADMPPIDSLDEHSDYRGFLSPKVSEALRRTALRKLFGLSRFNVCDGLDDYAEDFTRFEPLGDLVTHEMRRLLERERDKLEQALGQAHESGQSAEVPRLAAVAEGPGSPDADPSLEPGDGEAVDDQAAGSLPARSKS